MNSTVVIHQAKCNERQLHIEFTYEIAEDEYTKTRVLFYFHQTGIDRILPCPIRIEYKNNLVCISGNLDIELNSIFYPETRLTDCRLAIWIQNGFEYDKNVKLCVANSDLTVKDNELFVPNDEIIRDKKSGVKAHSILSYLFACLGVVLLPVFAVDSVLALKGYRTLYPKESTSRGIKAMIKHMNARIYMLSGISFIPREFKTNLFVQYYEEYRKEPIIENQVLFLSERKDSPTGNLQRIRKVMEQYPELSIVLYQNETTVNNLTKPEIRKITKLIATSKLIVLDDFYPQLHFISLRKETKLVQLWHACGGFKTFGFSRVMKPGGPLQSSKNHRSYDYAFVSGSKMVDIYSEGFGIPTDHVIPLGVPRTDEFFDEVYGNQTRERLYGKYPNLKEKKVVLIAPTFRGDGNRSAYYPEDKLDINQLCEMLPDEYVFVLKHHPFVKTKWEYEERYASRVVDGTKTEEMNDLLFIADILITDYSSVVFEATLLNVPIIFYAFDLEEYMKDRDIYYDFTEFAPGPIVKDFEQLCKAIQTIESHNQIADFRNYFMDAIDGNSTKRIAEYLRKLCNS